MCQAILIYTVALGSAISPQSPSKTSFPRSDCCLHIWANELGIGLSGLFVDLLFCFSISFGQQIELMFVDTQMPHMRKQEIVQNYKTPPIIALQTHN